MERKQWQGTVKKTDDFKQPIDDTFIDGKTVMGPWAIMSPKSFKIYGVGLGPGKGQKYMQETENGPWFKVEG